MVKQSIETVSADMEIDESIEVQKKGWIIQRIGWILMGVFILLAALGMSRLLVRGGAVGNREASP